MTDIIQLQNANVTQGTNGHIKTPWTVKENITGTDLFTLPKDIIDKDMFKVMDFAREYELIAFNKGIAFGKEKTVKVYDEKLKHLQFAVNEMRAENERLAEALEREMFKDYVEI